MVGASHLLYVVANVGPNLCDHTPHTAPPVTFRPKLAAIYLLRGTVATSATALTATSALFTATSTIAALLEVR